MNTVVTFYSYKGGVGRTMALANIAVLLARQGHRVLTVDFDLEAPGLDRYLHRHEDGSLRSSLGLLDLLTQQSHDAGPIWSDFVTTVEIEDTRLDALHAGRADEHYNQRVLDLDWPELFRSHDGSAFFERMREDWKNTYDFVLVDSRTGITDSGGVCTIQLPDVLVPVVTPGHQSLYGSAEIVRRAQAARQMLQFDRAPLIVFPLPSRFESGTEYLASREWLSRVARELDSEYSSWVPSDFAPISVAEKTKLPSVAFHSFGESMPVLTDSLSDPQSLAYAYRVAAELLETNFESVNRLLTAQALPTDERDRVKGLAEQITASIDQLSPQRKGIARELLSRLAFDSEATIPISILDREELATAKAMARHGAMRIDDFEVSGVESAVYEEWMSTTSGSSDSREFLKAMDFVRQNAAAQIPLSRIEYARALGWMLRSPKRLLNAEVGHILYSNEVRQRSIHRRRNGVLTRLLSSRELRIYATIGAVVGGVIGILLSTTIWFQPTGREYFLSVLAGTLSGLMLGGYVGAFRGSIAARRRRSERWIVDVQKNGVDSWMRSLSAELTILNHEVEATAQRVIYGESADDQVLAYVIDDGDSVLAVIESPWRIARGMEPEYPFQHAGQGTIDIDGRLVELARLT